MKTTNEIKTLTFKQFGAALACGTIAIGSEDGRLYHQGTAIAVADVDSVILNEIVSCYRLERLDDLELTTRRMESFTDGLCARLDAIWNS